ncbi:MAG TPA: leucyl aminopeptidase [Candidatus Hydrogenedens sp.]|nr:leucyl aminopeptidase [Candidatus Hydrogenedens sp.]HPP58058.1 leucyl aminopeptidase [Candidatus Hydrogenedens sp.]
MKVSVIHSQTTIEFDWNTALLIPIFETKLPIQCEILKEEQEIFIQSIIDRDLFSGKENDILYVPFASPNLAGVILLGLGKKEEFHEEKMRRIASSVINYTRNNKISSIVCDWNYISTEYIPPFIEGIILSQYIFDQYKTKNANEDKKTNPITNVTFIVSSEENIQTLNNQCEQTVLICNTVNMVRSLISSPANELTPQSFTTFAQNMFQNLPLKFQVLDKSELEREGLNGILAVGKGSKNEPMMMILEYQPSSSNTEKQVVIVGKGVTFDTGGICLKPHEGMQEMRYDMSGAAVVLGTMYILAELKLNIPVIGLIPLVENIPSGSALLPGDIIKMYGGKTVEVLNTDAEGRLIIADAMAYAQKNYAPKKIIDIATLTGGCIIALGHFCAGVLGNDKELIKELLHAGNKTGERLWEFPLWTDYEKLIQSDFADVANIGPKGEASTIVGGIFLKQFVENNILWAHIDIAGTAWGVKHIAYWDSKYPTGFGVRLLIQWLSQQ